MHKAFVAAVALSAIVGAGVPARSADLIQGYRAPTTTYQKLHRPKRIYVQRTVEECGVLLVDYRYPYEPNRHIIHLCNTVAGTPKVTRATVIVRRG